VEFLKSQSNVKKDRIGSIGWCMWRRLSPRYWRCRNPRSQLAVIHYGHLATDPESLKKINAAMLGIFGGQDRGIPVDDVKKFEQTFEATGQEG